MRPFSFMAALSAVAILWPEASAAAVPPEAAQQVFREAQAICAADEGRLWGRDLCGPMVIVDPRDRQAVANEPDPAGRFQAEGGAFVGRLPDEVMLANTATAWGGRRWTVLLWPLPEAPGARRAFLAHEMFHRIQQDLGLWRAEASNLHLDTVEGRALLRLEWRALDAALAADDRAAARRAVMDALAFRRERHRIHPEAAEREAALETNEGVASYTGARLGFAEPDERIAYARAEIAAFSAMPTYVRTFAYGTGPAYGLLLDGADPRWRERAAGGLRLDQMLQAALRIPDDALPAAQARAGAYGGEAIYAAERARHEARQAQLAQLKAQLVDGPRLVLPTKGANRQFNPQNILSLAPHGTVYPTLRLTGPWGSLDVERGGALLDSAGTAAVSLAGAAADGLQGDGWRLTLQPGWGITPGPRPGDLVVSPVGGDQAPSRQP